MGLNTFTVKLSDLNSLRSLRTNAPYYDPIYITNQINSAIKKNFPFVRLSDVTLSVTQGYDFRIMDNEKEGDVGFLTIENIDDDTSHIIEPSSYMLASDITQVKLLKKGMLITPRVRKIGSVNRIEKSDSFMASENILIIELDKNKLIRYGLDDFFVTYYLSFIGKHELKQLRTGGESGSINQWLVQEIHIPLLGKKQANIIKKLKNCEEQILHLKKHLLPIQDIIDKTLVKFQIKLPINQKHKFLFISKFHSISDHFYLRSSANYRWFWDVNQGKLFDTSLSTIPLGNWVRDTSKNLLKKGMLSKEYDLIELENIESKTGRILDKQIVTEIGSDKIVFNDADIITSKLRAYLGYTVLNLKNDDLIGSTELIPLKVDSNVADKRFVKYLLLSKDYLEKIRYLMYGKEHPRIYIDDLLNIKIPDIDIGHQQKFVNEIETVERKNEELRTKIEKLKKIAENTIYEEMGLDIFQRN